MQPPSTPSQSPTPSPVPIPTAGVSARSTTKTILDVFGVLVCWLIQLLTAMWTTNASLIFDFTSASTCTVDCDGVGGLGVAFPVAIIGAAVLGIGTVALCIYVFVKGRLATGWAAMFVALQFLVFFSVEVLNANP